MSEPDHDLLVSVAANAIAWSVFGDEIDSDTQNISEAEMTLAIAAAERVIDHLRQLAEPIDEPELEPELEPEPDLEPDVEQDVDEPAPVPPQFDVKGTIGWVVVDSLEAQQTVAQIIEVVSNPWWMLLIESTAGETAFGGDDVPGSQGPELSVRSNPRNARRFSTSTAALKRQHLSVNDPKHPDVDWVVRLAFAFNVTPSGELPRQF